MSDIPAPSRLSVLAAPGAAGRRPLPRRTTLAASAESVVLDTSWRRRANIGTSTTSHAAASAAKINELGMPRHLPLATGSTRVCVRHASHIRHSCVGATPKIVWFAAPRTVPRRAQPVTERL
ncbi:hypothetical protein GCM10023108_08380 [Saccharopolyspora hordei]